MTNVIQLRPGKQRADVSLDDVQAMAWIGLGRVHAIGNSLHEAVAGGIADRPLTHADLRLRTDLCLFSTAMNATAAGLSAKLNNAVLRADGWVDEDPDSFLSMSVLVGSSRRFALDLRQAANLLEAMAPGAQDAVLNIARDMRTYDHGVATHRAAAAPVPPLGGAA